MIILLILTKRFFKYMMNVNNNKEPNVLSDSESDDRSNIN